MTSEHRHRLTVRPELGCPWAASPAPRTVSTAACLRPSGCLLAPGRAAARCISGRRAGFGGHGPASSCGRPRPAAECLSHGACLPVPFRVRPSGCPLTVGRSFTSSPLGARPFRLAPISVCLPHAREGGASEAPPKHPEGASTPTFPTPNRACIPNEPPAPAACLNALPFAPGGCIDPRLFRTRSVHPLLPPPALSGPGVHQRDAAVGRLRTRPASPGGRGAGFFPLHPYTRIRARRAKQIADAPSEVCVRAHERGRTKICAGHAGSGDKGVKET